jgi:hypothetical protein
VNRQKLIEHTEQGDSVFDGPERSEDVAGRKRLLRLRDKLLMRAFGRPEGLLGRIGSEGTSHTEAGASAMSSPGACSASARRGREIRYAPELVIDKAGVMVADRHACLGMDKATGCRLWQAK